MLYNEDKYVREYIFDPEFLLERTDSICLQKQKLINRKLSQLKKREKQLQRRRSLNVIDLTVLEELDGESDAEHNDHADDDDNDDNDDNNNIKRNVAAFDDSDDDIVEFEDDDDDIEEERNAIEIEIEEFYHVSVDFILLMNDVSF